CSREPSRLQFTENQTSRASSKISEHAGRLRTFFAAGRCRCCRKAGVVYGPGGHHHKALERSGLSLCPLLLACSALRFIDEGSSRQSVEDEVNAEHHKDSG